MAGAPRERVVNDVTLETSTNGDIGLGDGGHPGADTSGAGRWVPTPPAPRSATGTGGEISAQLRLLRRRKWIVIDTAILVSLAAAAFSLHQQPRYQALASVLLTDDSGLTGLSSSNGTSSSLDRRAQTEADLARMQPVIRHTLKRIKVRGLTIDQFLGRSSVSPRANADILDFRVSDPSPARAQALTNAYANQFIGDRRRLQAKALANARDTLQEQARAAGVAAAALRDRARTLADRQTAASLALLVRPATKAAQVGPRPLQTIALGLVLGLLLGVAAAYLWNALDTTVRDVSEAGELLGLPLLGSVRARPMSIVMLEQPHGSEAEAFRILRANLDFANIDRSARVILVTAAIDGEAKSSTAANLAVAAALTGRSVVLVDLDLRHPSLDRLFGLEGQPGLTDVILGHAALGRALASIPLSDGDYASPVSGDSGTGTLEVLTSGPTPIDSGEFVGTKAVAQLVGQLRKRADIVLVNAPPLLPVVDARTLSTISDALIVVTNLDVVGRPALQELSRVLASCPTRVLGFVGTGDATDQHEHGYASERRLVLRRRTHEGVA
jgi:tyrosine-protein kinase